MELTHLHTHKRTHTHFLFGRWSHPRILAFPGASQRVSGEIEREFAKYSLRMMQAALSAVIDLASAILALDGSSGGTNSNNAACYEIANSWKRVQSYRNRVMGLYYPVLAYIYEEPSVPSVNPVNNANSSNASSNSQLNAFGNNKLSGDIGNLSGITVRLVANSLFLQECCIRRCCF